MLGDTADNGTVLQSVGNLELQQFLHLGNCFTFQYGSYTDIQLLELFKRNSRFDRISLIACSHILFFSSQQFVYLCLNCFVFYLLEQQFSLIQLMTFCQQVGTSQLLPFKGIHIQHLTKFFAAERQERFECNGQISYQLQCYIQDSGHARHIGLGKFPRFGVCQIFVTDTCQIHCFFLSIAELEDIQQFFYFRFYICKFLQCILVIFCQLSAGGNASVKVFLSQHQSTVHKVAVHGYQLIVVACLKVFPCEVIVLRFGSIGSQYIAKHILLSGEVL